MAFYECNEDYEFDSPDTDRLYCSKESWIGNRPNCISITNDDNGDEEYDEEEDDGNDQEGDGDEDEEEEEDGEGKK